MGWRDLPAQAIRAIGLWAGVSVLVLILSSRWLAGAMTQSISAPLIVGTILALSGTVWTALWSWRGSHSLTRDWQSWWPEAVTILLPAAWGLFVGWNASPFAVGALSACLVLQMTGIGLLHAWLLDRDEFAVSTPSTVIESVVSSSPTDHPPPATHQTWQHRLSSPDGDVIEGEAQVEFAAGQREAMVHLTFTPPLPAVPEIHAEDSLGEEMEIRTEAAYPFGARLSVRRSEFASAETRQISYSAVPVERSESAA